MRRYSNLGLFSTTLVAAAAASSCNLFFPFAPDQVCETQVRAICHFTYACCEATERAGLANGQFRSEGECVQELLEEGGGNCGNALQVHAATQQNRFTYDGALAETCNKPVIDALNNCESDVVFDAAKLDELVGEECDDVDGFAFGTGLVAEGGNCFNSFECEAPGSVCEPQEDDPDDEEILVTAVGTCKSPAPVGGDCSEDTGTDGLCEENAFCNADEECEEIELLGNGEDCFLDTDCESGFCNDLDFAAIPSCDDPLDDGEECFDDEDCLNENCQFDADDGTSACAPRLVVNAEICNGLQGDDTVFE